MRNKYIILIEIEILILFLIAGGVLGKIWCDTCEKAVGELCGDEKCTDEKPYCCKSFFRGKVFRSGCVVKGFDMGECGGTTDEGGYCVACPGGCKESIGKKCGSEICTADRPFCCDQTPIFNSGKFCRKEHSDCGCCGGPIPEGHPCGAQIKITLKRKGTSCTSPLTIKVQENCKGDFEDKTSWCVEAGKIDFNNIRVEAGETKEIKCTGIIDPERPGVGIPPDTTGPHCVMVEWCGGVYEFKYPVDCNERTERETCEADGLCWWDDHIYFGKGKCKSCDEIDGCGSYPAIWPSDEDMLYKDDKIYCPVCIRNPCSKISEDCVIGFDYDAWTPPEQTYKCYSCREKNIDECSDYEVASSCKCDACNINEGKGNELCNWFRPSIQLITVDASKVGVPVKEGSTLSLICEEDESVVVTGKVIDISGNEITFMFTSSQMEQLKDADCWF